MSPDEIKQMIEAGIEGAEVTVEGDDGAHFSARVISDAFAGLTMIKQHKLVYAALGDSMESAIHALSIQTFTREKWAKVSNSPGS